MTLPERVKIGPIVYEVCVVERLTDAGNNRTLWGNVKQDECRVFLEAGISDQQKRQTLLHEVIHVLLHQSGRPEQAEDEGLVEALGHGFMAVLIDNPALIEFVTEGFGEG